MTCYHDVIDQDEVTKEWFCVRCGDTVNPDTGEAEVDDLGGWSGRASEKDD